MNRQRSEAHSNFTIVSLNHGLTKMLNVSYVKSIGYLTLSFPLSCRMRM